MEIIGLTGKKYSGKTTTCDIALNYFSEKGFKCAHINFADPLKDEVYELLLRGLGYPREILDDPEQKKRFRALLQWWGTELRRQEKETYWTDQIEKSIEDHRNKGFDIFFISDVRFLDEAQLVKNLGGYVIRVKRPTDDNSDNHQSEKEIDLINPDFEILNQSDIKYLRNQIIQIIESI
jgi:dephospho-CoA kinase